MTEHLHHPHHPIHPPVEPPKRGPLIPFLILAGVLGVVAGFFLASALDVGSVRMKESPFGPEAGSKIPRGRDFACVGDNQKAVLGFGGQALMHIGKMGLKSASGENDSALAASALSYGLAKDPDHPWLNYVDGLFWEKSGRLDSAEARYRRALRAAPQFAYPYIRLGRLQLDRAETHLAETNFRTAIGLMESAPESYKPGKKMAIPPSEAAPYDYLATLYYQTGAEDSARMALEYGEEKGWHTQQMTLVQGWLFEARGFLHKADSLYRSLLKKEPDNPVYLEALGTLGWKPQNLAEDAARNSDPAAIFAISLLDPLARKHPRNAPLWMALGQAYYRRGLYGMATESFDSTMKYDSTLKGAAENRDLAYRAWIRENEKPKAVVHAPAPSAPAKTQAPLSAEEQAPVIIPGTNALLGTYSVPWGSSPTDVRHAYPKKDFQTLANGNLLDTFVSDGVKHEYLLAFKDGKLWGVRVFVTDTAGNAGDVFGRLIRIKTKISGEGKGTGEATCSGFRPFQGAIWENDDTFEFMAQFSNKENQVRLARIGRDYLPQNRRLCDLVPFLREDTWQ